MPAARSILSVVRMMLEAGLPTAEVLATLDACERALPPAQRNPVDNAPLPLLGGRAEKPKLTLHERVNLYGAAQTILAEECEKLGASISDYRQAGRRAWAIEARAAAFDRCRQELQMSYPQIGRVFGFDHSTVHHAISKYRAEKKDPAAPAAVDSGEKPGSGHQPGDVVRIAGL